MITVDLITGFLGSGKTTFIKKYVWYLINHGEKVCILENDFGAVNVDTLLLQEFHNTECGIETVSGACDKDCHKRRFKTKLIAIAMSGYTHVVIEPSGIFDVDEFFDTLRESPLDKWYKTGSIITIVSPNIINESFSTETDYILASQVSVAGKIVFSHCNKTCTDDIEKTLDKIKSALCNIKSNRDPRTYYIAKPWDYLTEEDYQNIEKSGCYPAEFVKMQNESQNFTSIYFMNTNLSPKEVQYISKKVMSDSSSCGNVLRIKGFVNTNNEWFEINATKKYFHYQKVKNGQPIIIVIGENLNKNNITSFFEEVNL